MNREIIRKMLTKDYIVVNDVEVKEIVDQLMQEFGLHTHQEVIERLIDVYFEFEAYNDYINGKLDPRD